MEKFTIYPLSWYVVLQNFLNNFQTAKEALSAATVHAAEKAATSVRDLAQRSFRLSMDIHLKAPVIHIPQSSVSYNAIVIDLGLIKIQNKFTVVSAEDCLLPPVMDKMDIQLTQLKMSRWFGRLSVDEPYVFGVGGILTPGLVYLAWVKDRNVLPVLVAGREEKVSWTGL